jgi:hypothetical protein
MQCPNCADNQYQKLNGTVNGKQRFRCGCCGRNYTVGGSPRNATVRELRPMNKCKSCGRETPNPRYCSRSCSATYSNRAFPKRTRSVRFCKYCGVEILPNRRVCDLCNPSLVDWSKRTLGEARELAKYQSNAQIRSVARYVYRASGRPYVCVACGYDKHVEICHIEAINRFPEATTIAVISHLDNLVALCPNCHWEFDHGLLQLDLS